MGAPLAGDPPDPQEPEKSTEEPGQIYWFARFIEPDSPCSRLRAIVRGASGEAVVWLADEGLGRQLQPGDPVLVLDRSWVLVAKVPSGNP